jgi:23S rRNA-/tRNA-specific pseudouridylate synthase
VLVLNKPMGLAVQGGSGTYRHLDGMLGSMTGKDGQRPRLVHRLDKDTSGCLLVAKTRFAATALAKTFRTRSARKIYWAMVAGVPRPKQGRVSTFLAKEDREDESMMRIARHGEDGCEPRGDLLRRGGHRGAETRLAVAQAGDRPHPPAPRPHGAHRPSDHRRREILPHREL